MPFLLRSLARSRQFNLPTRAVPALRSFTMTNTTYSNTNTESETPSTSNQTEPDTPKKPLALPEAPHNSSTQLDMSSGSASVSLDHLGPMVVNVDGTMSRISNWAEMADIEKENTVRIISARNKMRLGALRAKEGEK